ncbi:unnamed protein product, partial [Amoebophrya sp. A120]
PASAPLSSWLTSLPAPQLARRPRFFSLPAVSLPASCYVLSPPGRDAAYGRGRRGLLAAVPRLEIRPPAR